MTSLNDLAVSERIRMVLDYPIDEMTASELGAKLGIKAITARTYCNVMRRVGATRKYLVPEHQRKVRLLAEEQERRAKDGKIPLDAATWAAYQRELFTPEQMALHFRLV